MEKENRDTLEHPDYVRSMLPWLHHSAEAHRLNLERIDAIATSEEHRQALRTAYRVKIDNVQTAIMVLYDEITGTKFKAEAVTAKRSGEFASEIMKEAGLPDITHSIR